MNIFILNLFNSNNKVVSNKVVDRVQSVFELNFNTPTSEVIKKETNNGKDSKC